VNINEYRPILLVATS